MAIIRPTSSPTHNHDSAYAARGIVHFHGSDNTHARANVPHALWAGDVTPDNYVAATDLLFLKSDDLVAHRSVDSAAKTSNTTLADDDVITLAVKANARYLIRALLVWYGPGDTGPGDVKIVWTGPAAASMVGITDTPHSGVSSASGSTNRSVIALAEEHIIGVPSDTSTKPIGGSFDGVLTTGATAGNFTLRWAQNAASASPTSMKAGSLLTLRQFA